MHYLSPARETKFRSCFFWDTLPGICTKMRFHGSKPEKVYRLRKHSEIYSLRVDASEARAQDASMNYSFGAQKQKVRHLYHCLVHKMSRLNQILQFRKIQFFIGRNNLFIGSQVNDC